MAENRVEPELILCSSAVRTRQTLSLILPVFAQSRQVLYEDGLYLAEARNLLARLRQVPAAAASTLLVGHNPGLEELAAQLASRSRRLAAGLPTGALVIFELSAGWDELGEEGSRFVELVTPRELGRERDG
jgi:phosphohistidine phosphatase